MPKKSRKKRNSRFLSTLSLRRATQEAIETFKRSWISIHALLAESDPKRLQAQLHGTQFLSTLSLRRATNCSKKATNTNTHFYPRSPCGERLAVPDLGKRDVRISIHALLAESDSSFCKSDSQRGHFYPRSPCGERLVKATVHICRGVFLSTLSLRRATHGHGFQKQVFAISIHALLAESDDRQRPARPDCQDFYPRSPCGERRAEQSGNKVNHNFYPRSPCGERPFLSGSIKFCSVFLSTLSLRRATAYVLFCLCWCWISIHALLAESDCLPICKYGLPLIFLSTLSLRRATLWVLADCTKF